jgi:hydrogenase small subunit
VSVTVDAERIPEKGVNARCPKCRHVFKILPPEVCNEPEILTPNDSVICPDTAVTIYWLQCGGCGGDTWAMFNSEPPEIQDFCRAFNIEILWHPSLSVLTPKEHQQLNEDLISGRRRLDILCIEGSILRGPGGTGMFDTFWGKPKKDLAASLAKAANHVLAVGTCASFGGMGADSETEATGMQFHKWDPGGFMGTDFKTRSGNPVINLPGCPCHGGVITGALWSILDGVTLELGKYNEPLEWYDTMVHQGCTRNEYHEYRVEEKKFGEKGCLFFYLGCHGPLVYGPCNKMLWNRRSSKTRVGVPCFGCTRPDFPQQYPFFKTRNIEGIPIELPDGVNRAHYLAYKGIAAAAAPQRLKRRITGI